MAFLKRGDLADSFALAERLLGDEHDLIRKAVGWTLREAGKRSPEALVNFLEKHYAADLPPQNRTKSNMIS